MVKATNSPPIDSKNAVGAIRVSSVKQGTEGDSPEAQKEQIERFAVSKGFRIKRFFVFMESASKEQQPMQEAVDYCKDPKNKISHFIIKSIDHFTRGGSLPYNLLKSQLESSKVKLVDIYGIIGSNQINTLEHLGVEYKWSVYSPSKKSEILEAERSKDELRDIMTRLIGSQVRYARLGYWIRMAPYGYVNQKVDTPHGKRTLLAPHPVESKHVIELFKLRASGLYKDEEIIDRINGMGYCGRRSKKANFKVGDTEPRIEKRVLLDTSTLWRIVRHPVYVGISNEKWTNGKPIRFAFDGLVSINLFNQANKGRRKIAEAEDGTITIEDFKEERYMQRGKRDSEFPFKKYILCAQCNKPLLGSASTNRYGKRYPAYHCSKKRGHHFRVSKRELEEKVDAFFGKIKLSSEYVEKLFQTLESSWQQLDANYEQQLARLEKRLSAIKVEIDTDLQKIKVLDSKSTIKYMEEDITRLEKEAIDVEAEKQALQMKKPHDIQRIKNRLQHMVAHLDEVVKNQMDSVKKARLFGLFFNQLPTYAQLAGGTHAPSIFTGVNPIFLPKSESTFCLAGETGLEPATLGFGDRCSRPAELLPYDFKLLNYHPCRALL